jgi:hypothetical protein
LVKELESFDMPDGPGPDDVVDPRTGATRRQIVTASLIMVAVFGMEVLKPVAAAHAAVNWNHPFTKRVRIYDGFGWRVNPISGVGKQHNGIDYSPAAGTGIFAVGSGTVKAIAFNGDKSVGFGHNVTIDHGYQDGATWVSLYAHMSARTPLQVGQAVDGDTFVGAVGQTGAATGPHLHIEIRKNGTPIDPAPLIDNAPLAGGTMAISQADANLISQTLRSAQWYTGSPSDAGETKSVEGIYQGLLQTIVGYGSRTENIEKMVAGLGTRLAQDATFINAVATATAAKVKA